MPHASKPLAGRAALITGGSRGLGREIARAFVTAGASIMMCAREGGELDGTGRELCRLAGEGQMVRWRPTDVADRSAVDTTVQQAIDELGGLNILVNNAGVLGPFGRIEDIDWMEWIRAIEINLFGSVILMRAVLPHFKAQGHGKIIQLSGGGATSPMPSISAYAASKAAIVRLTETVAEECKNDRIDVNAIAPGALNTRMLDEVLAAGPGKVEAEYHARAMRQKQDGGAALTHAADLAVFLASAASDGITGRLISALWDDWACWPQHLTELESSDVYKLRRIIGRDRGFPWGDK
jgi:NAD(P)-dependent dehydrogenase (short-subunit alcohol dehydrogenase family)